MGFRYRKSVNLGGGVRLNLSKKGVGVSAGVKGLRVSLGADGKTRFTASIPGTGISYQETLANDAKSNSIQTNEFKPLKQSEFIIEFLGTIGSFYQDGVYNDNYVENECHISLNNEMLHVSYEKWYLEVYYDDIKQIRIEKKITTKRSWFKKWYEVKLNFDINTEYGRNKICFNVEDEALADRVIRKFKEVRERHAYITEVKQSRKKEINHEVYEDLVEFEESLIGISTNEVSVIDNVRGILEDHFDEHYSGITHLGEVNFISNGDMLSGDVFLVDSHVCILTNEGQVSLNKPIRFGSHYCIAVDNQMVTVEDNWGNQMYQLHIPKELNLNEILVTIEEHYEPMGLGLRA